jgi:hypothetical protein
VTHEPNNIFFQKLYCPTNAHNVKTYSYYNMLKLRRLLQHVSVCKETIIREPQPVLSCGSLMMVSL